jgi:hypothetical protein
LKQNFIPSSANLKNAWSYVYNPSYAFRGLIFEEEEEKEEGQFCFALFF